MQPRYLQLYRYRYYRYYNIITRIQCTTCIFTWTVYLCMQTKANNCCQSSTAVSDRQCLLVGPPKAYKQTLGLGNTLASFRRKPEVWETSFCLFFAPSAEPHESDIVFFTALVALSAGNQASHLISVRGHCLRRLKAEQLPKDFFA